MGNTEVHPSQGAHHTKTKGCQATQQGQPNCSEITEKKCYDPNDTSLKFVTREDDITLDEDPNIRRAEMSCGHAVSPQSLTLWCQHLLEQGQYKFKCPALKYGKRCDAVWSYAEVRKMALLTPDEQSHFEETMADLAGAKNNEKNSCPNCRSFVEREDLSNLCVKCFICTAEKGRTYQFCWQCGKEWKGTAPRSDKCDNIGCTNQPLEKLLKCKDVSLPEVKNIEVPMFRACPTCGNIVEHEGTGCKNIICNRCNVEFCFSCLQLTSDCHKTSCYFRPCKNGVAPRQTSIPLRKK